MEILMDGTNANIRGEKTVHSRNWLGTVRLSLNKGANDYI